MRPDWLTVVRLRYVRDWDNPPLAAWLRRLAVMGATVRDSSFAPRVDLVRNREVGRWLEEDRTEYLLMIDSDMVPAPETAAILVEDGDLVWCPYVDQAGRVIDPEKQGIGTGCMRISRRLAETLAKPDATGRPRPWFDYVLADSGREVRAGEAFTFTRRCLEASFRPKAVGRCGHLLPMVVLPSAEEGLRSDWRFLWQFQT